MFVAWRDLKFAKGRFALLGLVVALITLLIGFLTGLTVGLGSQSISAVESLDAQQFVMSPPNASGKLSFSDSAISETDAEKWQQAAGVETTVPLGIGQSQAQSGDSKAAIALFGAPPGSFPDVPSQDGEVVLSKTNAAQLGNVAVGESIKFGGREYRVANVVPDEWYSHLPVVWMTLADWQQYAQTVGQADPYATVLVVDSPGDYAAGNRKAGTASAGGVAALMAIGSFSSEIGSLVLIVGMLFAISAVVIGAFFTVWIIQRTPDIAVLKALGASKSALFKDALGQALVVLVIGVAVGMAVTIFFGVLMITLGGSAVPFSLSVWTTLLPAALLVITGLIGASFALRSVTNADPLTALGANR